MSIGSQVFTTPHNSLAIGLALALAAAPAVAADDQLGFVAGAPAPEAADMTQGMAIMSAAIEEDGTLIPGFGYGVVSAQKNSTGSYTVRFSRSLLGCAPMVSSPWGTTTMFAVGGVSAQGTVIVSARTTEAALVDRPFWVFVFCAQ